MKSLFKTKTGRIRLIGFLEGISLVILVFIAVPMKYFFDNPSLTKLFGPVHGAIFLLFLLNIISLGVEQKWKFSTTTWKILAACFIPFGMFYIDNKILKEVKDERDL